MKPKPGFEKIVFTVETSKLRYLSERWSESMLSRIASRALIEAYKREVDADPNPSPKTTLLKAAKYD